MKSIRVNSVSEYIKELENLGTEKFIFRGQNEPCYDIRANGFRTYSGGCNTDKIYNIYKISNDYYQQVISKLSSEEKKYFLAFCQHHGIPTNLIDFSYSPLIALFFACQGKKEPVFSLSELIGETSIDTLKGDSFTQQRLIDNLIDKLEKPMLSQYAQIYLLNKKWLLDITDLIIQVGNANFLEEICNNKDIRNQLIDKLVDLFQNMSNDEISECIIQIIECYKMTDIDFYGDIYSDDNVNSESIFTFQQDLKKGEFKDVILFLYSFVCREMEYELISLESDFFHDRSSVYELAAATYILLLANLVHIYHNEGKGGGKLSLNLKIYFTYQPANLFDRINSQKGLFIYQSYIYSSDTIYDYNILSAQGIIPDITIEIDNYEKILSELNTLGINLGSVYGDLDNIAKSVVYSYRNKNQL